MKIRSKTTFTARFNQGTENFFIEAIGYPLINGFITTKKIIRDNDGDFKYSTEWAIYDQFSGALIGSASTPSYLLDKKATPAQVFNKQRKLTTKNNIAKHRETLPKAENASHFVLGKLTPLPKPKKEALTSGYSALNKLITLIDAEIKHCIALDGIDTQGFKNQETATQYGKIIFQFDRSKFTIWKRQENLRAFKTKVKSVKNSFKDALSTQPQHVASEWIQPRGVIIDGLKITDIPVAATEPTAQAAPVAIKAPAAVFPKIKQPAKPLATLANLNLHEIQQDVAAAQHRGRVYASEGRTMLSIISTRELIMASNLAAPPATTCNPEATRLRAKATTCRAANRPTWAEKLEAQADALERTDPPEPPPCKHKNKIHRQRPHKTACILLAKIRHPIRQNFRQPTNEPPGIKPVTPSAHFYQTNQTERLTPWPALNLHPVTHQQPLSRSKQNEAIYPCPPPPSFAASALQPGKTGKPAAFPCPPPFGAYSTSYWITQSCSTRIKQTEATHEQKNIIL